MFGERATGKSLPRHTHVLLPPGGGSHCASLPPDQVITTANNTLNSISSSTVCTEVIQSAQGMEYLLGESRRRCVCVCAQCGWNGLYSLFTAGGAITVHQVTSGGKLEVREVFVTVSDAQKCVLDQSRITVQHVNNKQPSA